MFHLFLKCDNSVVGSFDISSIDTSRIEELVVVVTTNDHKEHIATGINAIELIMQTRPGALEGKRLAWPKFAWVLHNLVGHPLMQMLALIGRYRLAMKVHEGTVPRPLGVKK